jgi:hypothetical protein
MYNKKFLTFRNLFFDSFNSIPKDPYTGVLLMDIGTVTNK